MDRRQLFPSVSLNNGRKEIKVNGKTICLTPKEFKLIQILIAARGNVLSREQILEKVWGGAGPGIETRTVDQHISSARSILGSRIATVNGFGYRWVTRKPE